MLNDRICTISVVPTLAPSMMASAGTQADAGPSGVNELVISAVAVLLWSRAVRPRPAPKAVKRLLRALASNRRRFGSERAQDPAVDHMQAPQQQCDAAHQIEENQTSHALSVSAKSSRGSGYRLNEGDQPFNLPKIAPRSRAAVSRTRPSARAPGSVNGIRTQPLHCEPLR